jgi:hypothetical protein
VFDDDLFPRVGRACRIGPLGDVEDAPVATYGVVLVDLPHLMQRAQVEQLGVVRWCRPPCRLSVLWRYRKSFVVGLTILVQHLVGLPTSRRARLSQLRNESVLQHAPQTLHRPFAGADSAQRISTPRLASTLPTCVGSCLPASSSSSVQCLSLPLQAAVAIAVDGVRNAFLSANIRNTRR